MKESGKERFILTKSYEIAYALFRLAGPMREFDFAEKLRAAGADLLEAVAAEDYAAAGRAAQIVECLVKFAGDANLIGMSNADITLKEVYALDAAIAERKNAARADEVNVAEIFSKTAVAEKPANDNPANRQTQPAILHRAFEPAMKNPATEEPAIAEPEDPASSATNSIKSAIRQTAILDKIRQSGNCRLKDIQDILPGTSERTIRYDLQTLLEQNLIERVGNAGPSVFYRAMPGAQ